MSDRGWLDHLARLWARLRLAIPEPIHHNTHVLPTRTIPAIVSYQVPPRSLLIIYATLSLAIILSSLGALAAFQLRSQRSIRRSLQASSIIVIGLFVALYRIISHVTLSQLAPLLLSEMVGLYYSLRKEAIQWQSLDWLPPTKVLVEELTRSPDKYFEITIVVCWVFSFLAWLIGGLGIVETEEECNSRVALFTSLNDPISSSTPRNIPSPESTVPSEPSETASPAEPARATPEGLTDQTEENTEQPGPVGPDAIAAPDGPGVPEAPVAQDAPADPEEPTVQDVPAETEEPTVQGELTNPEEPTVQDVAAGPEAPAAQDVAAPEVPTVQDAPADPEAPTVQDVPADTGAPIVHGVTIEPEANAAQDTPVTPEVPDTPDRLDTPNVPITASASNVPSDPSPTPMAVQPAESTTVEHTETASPQEGPYTVDALDNVETPIQAHEPAHAPTVAHNSTEVAAPTIETAVALPLPERTVPEPESQPDEPTPPAAANQSTHNGTDPHTSSPAEALAKAQTDSSNTSTSVPLELPGSSSSKSPHSDNVEPITSSPANTTALPSAVEPSVPTHRAVQQHLRTEEQGPQITNQSEGSISTLKTFDANGVKLAFGVQSQASQLPSFGKFGSNYNFDFQVSTKVKNQPDEVPPAESQSRPQQRIIKSLPKPDTEIARRLRTSQCVSEYFSREGPAPIADKDIAIIPDPYGRRDVLRVTLARPCFGNANPVTVRCFTGRDAEIAGKRQSLAYAKLKKHNPGLKSILALLHEEEQNGVLMHFMPLTGKSISAVLAEMGGQYRIAQKQVRQIAYQILVAVNSLHNFSLIHCNVNPQNIVFSDIRTSWIVPEEKGVLKTSERTEVLLNNTRVYLTDFTSSCPFESEGLSEFTKVRAVDAYSAPELLQGMAGTRAIDAWALGVTLHAIAYEPLFPEADLESPSGLEMHLKVIDFIFGHAGKESGKEDMDEKTYVHARRVSKRFKRSPLFCRVLKGLLKVVPDERASLEATLEHEYFDEVRRELHPERQVGATTTG